MGCGISAQLRGLFFAPASGYSGYESHYKHNRVCYTKPLEQRARGRLCSSGSNVSVLLLLSEAFS